MSILCVAFLLTYSRLVVLYYDYVLTVVTEYNRYWVNSRLSWASFLFFLNRYSALIAHVVTIIQFFWEISDKVSLHSLYIEKYLFDSLPDVCYCLSFSIERLINYICGIGVVTYSGSVKSTVRSLSHPSQVQFMRPLYQKHCDLWMFSVATSNPQVLLCIRTYALYGQNRLLLFALIFLNSCGLAISCVSIRWRYLSSHHSRWTLGQWAIITSQLFPGAPKGRIAICGLPVTREQCVLFYEPRKNVIHDYPQSEMYEFIVVLHP